MPPSRVNDFGELGERLSRLLPSFPEVDDVIKRDLAGQLLALERWTPALSRRHPLLPAAVSLLLLDYPLQLPKPEKTADGLLRLLVPVTLPSPLPREARKVFRALSRNSSGRREVLAATFPRKGNVAAATKNSVLLHRLAPAIGKDVGSIILDRLARLPPGTIFDDQACNILLFFACLYPLLGPYAADVSVHLVTRPADAKGLSSALKALGCNSTRLGACLTESQALQGRGVGDADLAGEVAYRCDPLLVREKVLNVDVDELRPHIQALIASELPDPPEIEEVDKWWSRRWLWCVNGTENSLSDRALKLDSSKWKRTHSRAYRKMAAEGVEADPTAEWDGTTLVSVSPKLEHGKTRAIFACDTLSYFAFTRILDPVQKRWRNRRILLDPGSGGTYGMVSRIREVRQRGGVNLMLDYDDFNSHHSTDVMKMVFEELCKHCRVPAEVSRPLVDSFDKTFVSFGGELRHVEGTLMSGHRGTTFINSVLNAAYIRAALGAATFDAHYSLHTGDDVYICAPTLRDCAYILRRCKEYGCRMNPSKQSVGYTSAEFLRCSIGPQEAYGYACRSIASLTCGSWVNPNPLEPLELLKNVQTTVRSLINRSGTSNFVRAVARSLRVGTGVGLPLKVISGILSGSVSLDDGPIFGGSGLYVVVRSSVAPETIEALGANLPSHASRSYLASHVSPIEALAMSRAAVDPLPLLMAQSYSKGRNLDKVKGSRRPAYTVSEPQHALGSVTVADLAKRRVTPGCLEKYPLIRFVASRLTRCDLADLVACAGGNPAADDLEVEAFGPAARVHRFVGVLPLSDAARLSRLGDEQNVYTNLPIFM